MRLGMAVSVVVLRAGRPVTQRPSPRRAAGGPCRGRGVPASPQRSGCSATGAAEQSGAGKFAADRLKPAQVLARLGAVQVAAPNDLFPSNGRRSGQFACRATGCVFRPDVAGLGLARRGSVWHGPLPWRRPRPQTCRLPPRNTAPGERWILRELVPRPWASRGPLRRLPDPPP